MTAEDEDDTDLVVLFSSPRWYDDVQDVHVKKLLQTKE